MKISVLLIALFCALACSHAIPEQYLARMGRSPNYPAVQAATGNYLGTTVVWGGTIHQVRNTPEGTYVEIIESPLDHRGRPQSIEKTRGRFLALIPGFAEPELYVTGKEITVAGQVRGVQDLPLGEIVYSYPVLLREYDRLWNPVVKPDVHLGVGVGAVFGH